MRLYETKIDKKRRNIFVFFKSSLIEKNRNDVMQNMMQGLKAKAPLTSLQSVLNNINQVEILELRQGFVLSNIYGNIYGKTKKQKKKPHSNTVVSITDLAI
jgi:hypothetical protein